MQLTHNWNFVCSKTTHNKWDFERQKPRAISHYTQHATHL